MSQSDQQVSYQFTGPDEQGFIRLRMPDLDPAKHGEFFLVTMGCDKAAIAEAMRQWLSSISRGEAN